MRVDFAVVLMLACAGGAQLQAQESMYGIWGTEVEFGPALRGDLVVRRLEDGWTASLRTATTSFQANRDTVSFSFAPHLGHFRGRLTDEGSIRGFWIQPDGVVLRNPYATPVVLTPDSGNVWRGAVQPLRDRYSLFIEIRRTQSGRDVAVFRNPELNQNARWWQWLVTRSTNEIAFQLCGESCASVDTTAETLRAVLREGTLTLWWPPLQRSLTLTPRTDADAVGLFPRVRRSERYAYGVPVPDGDGWSVARASSVGLDEAKLQALVQRIADTLPLHPRAPLIHSLLVARHGKLVLDEYFMGHDRERTHDIRSAGKTFTSVLLGALMQEGMPVSQDTRLAEFVPGLDVPRSRITLGHLMTHSSGLACDDSDESSPGNEDTMQNQRDRQPDYWQYTLDLPLLKEPGTYYAYCSGGMNLMGLALTRASRTWLPELFDRTIARPLEFGAYHWNLMPTLEGYVGGGAFLRPRDLLKVGQLYLDGGVWNGKRIVPALWASVSTTTQIEWPARGDNVPEGRDGFAWHLHTVRVEDRTYEMYEANGNGGQLLMVVPAEELVVVFTAGNYGHGGVWSRYRTDLLPNGIISAIVTSGSAKK